MRLPFFCLLFVFVEMPVGICTLHVRSVPLACSETARARAGGARIRRHADEPGAAGSEVRCDGELRMGLRPRNFRWNRLEDGTKGAHEVGGRGAIIP